MTFSKSIITLGSARVLNARVDGKGDINLITQSETALILKSIPNGCRQPVTGGRTVSYADECFILDLGKMHRRGEYEYEPD